ncbi:MAG TPA: magnesium transporter [Longimicrobiales bacterium]|nr:magnesium transporter [Longimicrobiales bacterium]
MSTPDLQHVEESVQRLARLELLLEAGDDAGLRAFLDELHPSDIADLIEHLDEEAERVRLLELLPADVASEALAEMEAHEHPEEILASLEPGRIGELIGELSNDDAADLIGDLDPEGQARVLATLAPMEAGELRELIAYPEDSAGGIMTTELVAISVHLTAGDAIQEVRRQARELATDFYNIFVVDLLRRLLGVVTLQDLVVAEPDAPIAELVEPPIVTVEVGMDQEEVGRLIARYNEPSVPVIGPNNVLLGRITWDDVMDVIEAEQTEDLLRLAGIGSEEEVQGAWTEAVRARLPWLALNTGTAALGALVIYLFTDTIDQMLALASLLPVIAALGGNAGTQSLAVTVRRLALTRESAARRWRVAAKEILVGLVNGAALGLMVGLAAYFIFGTYMLGVVVLLAMWGNLVVASFAGAFVPVLLERMGADPAVASSVFVTAVTDVAGFFLLLGLATRLLL